MIDLTFFLLFIFCSYLLLSISIMWCKTKVKVSTYKRGIVFKTIRISRNARKYIRMSFFTLAIIPALGLFFYLKDNSVNVPYWDQFELVPIIQHVNNNSLTFNDLWQQHNEHRIFLPRIIMLTSASITKWNVKFEVMISWIIAVGSFALLFVLLRMTARMTGNIIPIWLPLLLSLIFFSILQYENWLWGWQIQWFLSVFGVFTAVYGVAKLIKSPKSITVGLIFAIIGGLVAQYSLGAGVLIWPITITALIYCRINWRLVLLTALVATTSTVLFYINYHDPSGSVSKLLAFQEPVNFFAYIVLYLGRPLSYVHIIALISGVSLIVAFLTAAVYLFKKYKTRFKQNIPWFMIGLYAIMSAGVTGLSRLGYGVGQSLSSRYTTISLLLLTSIIALVVLNRDILKGLLKKLYLPIAASLVIIVFGLTITNAQQASAQAGVQIQHLEDIKGCTHQQTPSDLCYLSAYPDATISKDRINYLKEIHWGGY